MNDAFNSIRQGLEEAIEYSKGKNNGSRVHCSPGTDVKAIRTRVGMNVDANASIRSSAPPPPAPPSGSAPAPEPPLRPFSAHAEYPKA